MTSSAQPADRGIFSQIFISPGQKRLRALWRLLIFAALLAVLTFIFSLPLILINVSGFTAILVSYIASALAATAAVFITHRLIDRESIGSLGLRLDGRAAGDLAAGIAVMGLLMGLIYLVLSSMGWLSYEATAFSEMTILEVMRMVVLPALYLFILVGWLEEIVFRGYLLQNISSGLNVWWGLGISSVLFAAAHALNPGISIAAIAGLFGAGLFLGFAYIRTRQLWLPVGLHIGWNFFEGPVFGFPVSGLNIPRLVQQSETGPDLWTGGPFGPEAGLIVLPALALGAVIVYYYTHRRQNQAVGEQV
jgi:membrane protease YdiL (CAAX protease family)